jgi:hypothetical protein
LAADERPSNTNQPTSRMKIRYSKRTDTAHDHAPRAEHPDRRSSRSRPASGTRQVPEPSQFVLDTAMAPARVLPRRPDHQTRAAHARSLAGLPGGDRSISAWPGDDAWPAACPASPSDTDAVHVATISLTPTGPHDRPRMDAAGEPAGAGWSPRGATPGSRRPWQQRSAPAVRANQTPGPRVETSVETARPVIMEHPADQRSSRSTAIVEIMAR